MIKLLLPSALEYEFAFDLMKENMKKYYDLYGIAWDQEWVHKTYIDKENYIITKLNEKIGFLSLEKKHNELYVHTVQICPKFQNQRIGLYVLRALVEMMQDLGLQNLICRVFKDSQALAMYERLGFERVAHENFLITMKCSVNKNIHESEFSGTLTRRSSGRLRRRLALRWAPLELRCMTTVKIHVKSGC